MTTLRVLGQVRAVPTDRINVYTLIFTASSPDAWQEMWRRPIWRFSLHDPNNDQKRDFALVPIQAGRQEGLTWITPYRFKPEVWGQMDKELNADFAVDTNLAPRTIPLDKNLAALPIHHFSPENLKMPIAGPPFNKQAPAAKAKKKQKSKPKSNSKLVITELPEQSQHFPQPSVKQSAKSARQKKKSRAYSPPPINTRLSKKPSLFCMLCGQPIKSGTLLEHRAKVHGEVPVTPSAARQKPAARPWISIVQGGLPGLGKRR